MSRGVVGLGAGQLLRMIGRLRASGFAVDVAVAAILLALALSLRLAWLQADPPVASLGRLGNLQISGVFLTDEGWYSRNARIHALEGTWTQPGDLNPIAITPLFSAMQRVAFEISGVSLIAARTGPALLGGLAPAVLFVLLRRPLGRPFAMVGALLLATDFTSVMYSRLALTEIPYITLLLTSAALLLVARRHASHGLAAGSACVGLLAIGFKLSAVSLTLVVIVDAVFVAVVLGFRYRGGAALSPVALAFTWAATLAAGATIFFASWVEPFGEDAAWLTSRLLGQRLGGVGAMVRGYAVFLQDGVPWHHWPILFPLGLGGSLWVLAMACRHAVSGRFQRGPPGTIFEMPPVEVRFLALWLLVSTAGVASLSYQPLRYFLILVPSMAGLAAIALQQLWRRGPLLRVTAALTLGAAIAISAFDYVAWAAHPRYSLLETAHSIGRRARADTPRPVICGRIADTLALENRLPTVNLPIGRPLEYIGPRLRRYPPTHLLLLDGAELPRLSVRYPETFGRASPIGSFELLKNYYTAEPVRLLRLEH
ncbi:MAG: glycosyltransferase family 39 protein [Candidatus Wallbacteria bacterium]|nr:glycosyltransferase family 39 protein [Candidatus Wallbacteria bacterium]